MSITINGTTNTLTAASGLTIAGNTAVTGKLTGSSGVFAAPSAGSFYLGAAASYGALLSGNGATTDVVIANKNGSTVAQVLTGEVHLYHTGLGKFGPVAWALPDAGVGHISGGASVGLFLYGAGSVSDVLITNKNGANALAVPTGTINLTIYGNLVPSVDNTSNLGSASFGMKELFSDNGTINTSDARRKTEVSALSAAEINAAKQLGKEIGSFKFLAAVAEKGDAARLHIGMTVQRAIEIMEANGLNPFAYSFICYDQWDQQVVDHPAVEAKDAVLDDEGNVVAPAVEAKDAWTEVTLEAGDKYSFRVHELLLFMSAGFEARLTALEAA